MIHGVKLDSMSLVIYCFRAFVVDGSRLVVNDSQIRVDGVF